jgi:riboflavin synthase
MFTGIVEEVGRVIEIVQQNGNRRLTVAAAQLNQELKQGDSIAVSGVCLTAVEITPTSFAADLAAETWERTSFSRIRKDALVNLELPMRADGRFGGHIVQGHVDGTGKFLALDRVQGADDYWLQIEIPAELARYVIFKGSLCIEGISLIGNYRTQFNSVIQRNGYPDLVAKLKAKQDERPGAREVARQEAAVPSSPAARPRESP